MTTGRLIALALASALVALSTLGIYYAHQLPTEEQFTITLLSYGHTGEYDYTANLKPNIIYNQSTLKPGEGILYRRITESIDTTFTYKFQCGQPANGKIRYEINASLESPSWKKSLKTASESTINLTGTSGEFSFNYPINIASLEELINALNTELGTSPSDTYTLTISPEIGVTATTDAGTIDETFTPTLTVKLKYRTPQGDQITIEGLQHTRPGAITQTKRIHLAWVTNLRYASYASLAITIPALIYTAWTTTKAKLTEEKPIEEITEPYREIIAETTQEPPPEAQTTIPMKTLEDLAKVADTLGKLIFHTQKDQDHTFYVLDNSTRYEYTTTTPQDKRTEKKENP